MSVPTSDRQQDEPQPPSRGEDGGAVPGRVPVDALRVELVVPVASYRDPMFPGVSRCLPVPPPSTVRGMLAAATGRPSERVPLGMAANATATGVDLETYHPIAANGSNPAIGGRVAPGKGGMTIRERPFLTGVRATLWIPGAAGRRIEAALRRPVWGLRLGRSQDLVHLAGAPRWTTLHPARRAVVGHGLAPTGAHEAPQAVSLRMAVSVSTDRLSTSYRSFLWCAEPAGEREVRLDAFRDSLDGQAVWLLDGDGEPDDAPEPAAARRGEALDRVLAKSVGRSIGDEPERLTAHSAAVRDAARALAARIGPAGPIAGAPRFWAWVEQAALLHDAGKIAEGFQRQLRPGGEPWGQRHEVLSLAYVDLFHPEPAAAPPGAGADVDREMVATGVLFHHRALTTDAEDVSERVRPLARQYSEDAAWKDAFGGCGSSGAGPVGPAGSGSPPRIQIPRQRHAELLAWYADQAGLPPEPGGGAKMWQRARALFLTTRDRWFGPVREEDGLLAVLLQGAVTLADHAGSAHVPLQTHMPLPARFLDRLAAPYDHQRATASVDGHVVVIAPTGAGKTEAGLAWASSQLAGMPGQPRLVWMLPYRASIDAVADRFRTVLDPPPMSEPAESGGSDTDAVTQSPCTEPDIGILHATAARTLLERAVDEDCPSPRDAARKARARAGAARLFAQRVRVATPHQLLRGAIAGPRYSSVLLEQANCLMVLDELHAYDPVTFGRICAAMRLWSRLGSRIAVLSATFAEPMIEMVRESVDGPCAVVRAAPGTAPDRHHLVLDELPLTAPASLDTIRGWLAAGRSVLAVANSVRTAQHLFDELAPAAREAAGSRDPDAAILLHSRFRARDRAEIERRVLARHPERRSDDPALRGGGLVVSTQVLEVSLCLDFDRGASELAPIEAVAQRAGRVNRRGRHPDGPVAFHVHQVDSPLPYEQDALDAAWSALRRTADIDPRISEQTVALWLDHVYGTDWGTQWLATARRHREEFWTGFLTFPRPFHDRSEFAGKLDEQFDTVHVLHADDLDEYRTLADHRNGDPLLAEGLLIPLRWRQCAPLRKAGLLAMDRRLRLPVVSAPYSTETGLDLSAASGGTPATSAARQETIL
ncbi:CRISPR-associated helicase Cas3/CRISPR-associated endonuclease Cas3-HD [Frankia canadensis]|uniref:CRISPR-associated helicase Cas3/CRISPR-associated endonuclease Cas3-HD n=1 Tax=Frankia canadensis TaxID=1836972 RepID=A0A2I2KSJ5_9ACTN|nr:CRISPR-associated helicase/endonuclease Cas3 [Frankia canadensis]SNQ48632.1 CRISPR-associated helicase Cas3/CRISPR-associated endonuclease Cas3-HD [Frankia canadensis]SOU55922.1 CRISPR-associated helicase Cas3/CRISPR-associated endonuclease Cas3-HD [Frankia canadensis]